MSVGVGPSGMGAIATRIAELSQAPSAVAEIKTRFEALVQQAAAVTETASIDSTSPDRGVLVGDRSATALPSLAATPASTTSPVTTTPVTTTGTAGVSGTWAQRVPNARGQALVPAIAETAQRYGLDPAFLAAVFWTESSYTPDVVSPTGAIGLGQLMPTTAASLGVDPWDPMQNMDGAARLYRYYLDKYNGDIELSISAYAAGPGAVANAGGIPDHFTANYIAKLLGRRDYLNGLRNDAP